MDMIISLIGKNIKPMALRIKLHFYRAGKMGGIKLHAMAGQLCAFQRPQNAAACIILPDAGNQDRVAAEGRQMPRHIKRRASQNLAFRKPVYKDFAEQKYGLAGDSHRLPLEENLFIKRKKETNAQEHRAMINLLGYAVMCDNARNVSTACKPDLVKRPKTRSVTRYCRLPSRILPDEQTTPKKRAQNL
jgi:hypothetical protein